jgi:magnesium transporter
MQVLERFDAGAIRALHAREEFFWLDLVDPSDEELDELGRLLEIPPLAVADTKEFHQRPKIDDFRRRVLLVFYGAHEDELVEVHVHISGDEVVTVRRGACGHLMAARAVHAPKAHTEVELVFRILHALTESLSAMVERRMAEVERLEGAVFERPSEAERRRITELRGDLFGVGQVVVAQRDMLVDGGELIECLPGLEGEEARHPFRDVHDQLVLTAGRIAYGREILADALNAYLATSSNRLNELATRITLIATIFVPLTIVTGFFGMNFGWLVDHIDTLWAFLVFGIGGMIVPVLAALALFLRAGLLRRREL